MAKIKRELGKKSPDIKDSDLARMEALRYAVNILSKIDKARKEAAKTADEQRRAELKTAKEKERAEKKKAKVEGPKIIEDLSQDETQSKIQDEGPGNVRNPIDMSKDRDSQVDQGLALAAEAQPLLDKIQLQISELVPGTESKHRIKDRQTAKEKPDRPGGTPLDQMDDFLAGMTIAQDYKTFFTGLNKFLEIIKENGISIAKIDDRLSSPNIWGYSAVHITLIMPNGLMVEYQILPSQIELASRDKEKGGQDGHKLYEKWRAVSRQEKLLSAEYRQDKALSEKIYSEALIDFLSSSDNLTADELNKSVKAFFASSPLIKTVSRGSASVRTPGFQSPPGSLIKEPVGVSTPTTPNLSDATLAGKNISASNDNITQENTEATESQDNYGETTTVYTSRNEPIDIQYKALEADEVVANLDESFAINPLYPQDLQPRERQSANMKNQVIINSQRLNPAILGENKTVEFGAPIVNKENITLSGNGRVLMIKRAYGVVKTTVRNYNILDTLNISI